MPNLDYLQQQLQWQFRAPEHLARALVHRSYLNEVKSAQIESNERLEFLGDALIGFAVANELYRRFPAEPEGRLTAFRAYLVRWETLASVGRRLNLGEYLQMGHGEERSGGRGRSLNLARAFEALMGAVLEDAGTEVAEAVVLRTLRPELEALESADDIVDIKSRLQEWSQARLGATPSYQTVCIDGPDHDRTFTVEVQVGDEVVGSGSGHNKRSAERAAAAEALERLQADDM